MLFILELSIITSKDDSQLVCEKVLEILMQRDKLDIGTFFIYFFTHKKKHSIMHLGYV